MTGAKLYKGYLDVFKMCMQISIDVLSKFFG